MSQNKAFTDVLHCTTVVFRSNTARVARVRKNATVLQSTDVFAIFSKINEGAS